MNGRNLNRDELVTLLRWLLESRQDAHDIEALRAAESGEDVLRLLEVGA